MAVGWGGCLSPGVAASYEGRLLLREGSPSSGEDSLDFFFFFFFLLFVGKIVILCEVGPSAMAAMPCVN